MEIWWDFSVVFMLNEKGEHHDIYFDVLLCLWKDLGKVYLSQGGSDLKVLKNLDLISHTTLA